MIMGALFGLRLGFMLSGFLSLDVLGFALTAIGIALQVVYWFLKLKGEKDG